MPPLHVPLRCRPFRSHVAIICGRQVSTRRSRGVSCPSACRLCLVAHARLSSQRERSRRAGPVHSVGRRRLKPPRPQARIPTPGRGRDLFHASGCSQCHRVDAAISPGPPNRTSVWQSGTARGCLADEPAAGGQAPDFRLSDEDRKSLQAFLRLGVANVLHDTPAEASERLIAQLRCAACHSRDGRSSRRGRSPRC